MDVKISKEEIDKASIQVIYKTDAGISGVCDREIEYYLHNAVENEILATMHPRTSINIVVQVLSQDGSMLSCALNGICLALLDAGIPLRSLISSVTCAMTKNGVLLLDPDAQEEESCSVFTFAFDHTLNGIITSKTSGVFDEQEYFTCLEGARQGCSKVLSFIRTSVETKHSKKLKS